MKYINLFVLSVLMSINSTVIFSADTDATAEGLEMLLHKAGISDTQIKTLMTKDQELQKEISRVEKLSIAEELKLEAMLEAEPLDQDSIEKQIKLLADLMSEMYVFTYKEKSMVRSVCTIEQIERFNELRSTRLPPSQ